MLKDPIVPLQEFGTSHQIAQAWAESSALDGQVVVKRCADYELLREVVCNLVAQAIGLPVPKGFVVDTRESSWHAYEPFAFATQYQGFSNLLRRSRDARFSRDQIERWAYFDQAIGFDQWIANSDRTLANFLYAGRNKFLLIDHEQAIPNHIGAKTPTNNWLARHLIASNPNANGDELADRVLAAISHFSGVDFTQIRVAGLVGSWAKMSEYDECLGFLSDRIDYLPSLIEGDFSAAQGQLLG